MQKIFIGIDVSKKNLDVSVIVRPENADFGTPSYCGSFANTKSGCDKIVKAVRKMAGGIPEEDWLFCVETTGGYSNCVCDSMHSMGMLVWRESALQIKWSKGIVRGKDDKADSGVIAEYAMRNSDKCVPYVPDSPEVSNLKALFRYRASLVEERRAKLVRMKELKDTLRRSAQVDCMLKDMDRQVKQLDKSIAECQKRMAEIIDRDRSLKASYRHITSIKGMGMVNAVGIIIHTNNFQKISDSRKFGCYCGVAPFYAQSGTSVHGQVDVKHLSNLQMKALLSNAATVAIRCNPDIKAYYDRLVKAGKCKGIALNNTKNKLLRIVFSLIEHDCDYEENHEQKRAKIA